MADNFQALAQALLAAQQRNQQTNPMLAAASMPFQARTPYGQAATSIVQGLLAGYGQQQVNQQNADMMQTFGNAMQTRDYNALLSNPNLQEAGVQLLLNDQQQQAELQDFASRTALGEQIKSNIQMANDPRQQFLQQLAGGAPTVGGGQQSGVGGFVPQSMPQAAPLAQGMPQPVAPQGAPGLGDAQSQISNRQKELVLTAGLNPAEAYKQAQTEVLAAQQVQTDAAKEQQKLKDDYIAKLAEEEAAADSLIDAGTKVLKAAPDAASGPGSTVRGIFNEGLALLGSDSANKTYAARQLLGQIKPDVVGAARKKIGSGAGQTSDKDLAVYLGSGPTEASPPEQLLEFGNRYLFDGILGKQGAQFKRQFLMQPGATVAQADAIWAKYADAVKANPETQKKEVLGEVFQASLPLLLKGQTPPTTQQTVTPNAQALLQQQGGAGPENPTQPSTVVSSNGLAAGGDPLKAETYLPALIQTESSGNANAVSSKNAIGLTQITPPAVRDVMRSQGVDDSEFSDDDIRQMSFDPEFNLQIGKGYLQLMLDKYKDPKLALAAYNAGPGAVDQYGGVPPFEETQNYVQKVLSRVGDAIVPPVEAQTQAPQQVAAPQQSAGGASGSWEDPSQLTTREKIAGFLGAAGSGATFNFADEAAAGLRSILPGFQDYESELAAIRAGQAKFDKAYPKTSIAANIAGGAALPVGGLMNAKKGASAIQALAKMATGGGVLGAAYGAGAGGEPGGMSRKDAAIQGAAVGAVAGPVLGSAVNLGVKGATKAAEKFATTRAGQKLIQNVPEATKKALMAPFGADEAGRFKTAGANPEPAPLSVEDLQLLRMAGGTSVDELQAALQKLQKGGDLTLAEATENPALFLQTNELANNPDTMNVVRKVLDPRQMAAPQRIKTAFSADGTDALAAAQLGVEGAQDVVKFARKQIQQAAGPEYDAMVKAAPELVSKKMEGLLKIPNVRTYIKSAKLDFENNKLPSNATIVVKQALSDMGADLRAMKRAPMQDAAKIRRLENNFRQLKAEAYRLNPQMEKADIAYTKALASSPLGEKGLDALRAIDSGDAQTAFREVFSKDMDASQIAALRDAYEKAGQLQKWNAFVQGYVVKLIEDAPNVTANSYAGWSKPLRELVGSASAEKRLKAAVGEEAFTRINEALKLESAYLDGTRRYAMGSMTQPRGEANRVRNESIKGLSGWKDFAIDAVMKAVTPAKDVEQARKLAEKLVRPDQGAEWLQRIIPVQRSLEAIQKAGAATQKGATKAAMTGQAQASTKRKR